MTITKVVDFNFKNLGLATINFL